MPRTARLRHASTVSSVQGYVQVLFDMRCASSLSLCSITSRIIVMCSVTTLFNNHTSTHNNLVANCDASELLHNAGTVGDCPATLPSGGSCTNEGRGEGSCTPSHCFHGVLTNGTCVNPCDYCAVQNRVACAVDVYACGLFGRLPTTAVTVFIEIGTLPIYRSVAAGDF